MGLPREKGSYRRIVRRENCRSENPKKSVTQAARVSPGIFLLSWLIFFFFARDLLVSRCTYRCNAACYAVPFLLNIERIRHRMLDRLVSSLTSSPTRSFCVQKVNRLRSNNGDVRLSDYSRQFFFYICLYKSHIKDRIKFRRPLDVRHDVRFQRIIASKWWIEYWIICIYKIPNVHHRVYRNCRNNFW